MRPHTLDGSTILKAFAKTTRSAPSLIRRFAWHGDRYWLAAKYNGGELSKQGGIARSVSHAARRSEHPSVGTAAQLRLQLVASCHSNYLRLADGDWHRAPESSCGLVGALKRACLIVRCSHFDTPFRIRDGARASTRMARIPLAGQVLMFSQKSTGKLMAVLCRSSEGAALNNLTMNFCVLGKDLPNASSCSSVW